MAIFNSKLFVYQRVHLGIQLFSGWNLSGYGYGYWVFTLIWGSHWMPWLPWLHKLPGHPLLTSQT